MAVMLAVLGTSVVVGLIAFAAVIEGFVLTVLWRWFMVPLGAPLLTIPTAIGIALIVGMLTHQHSKQDDDAWIHKLVGGLTGPPLILCVGWVVKQFL